MFKIIKLEVYIMDIKHVVADGVFITKYNEETIDLAFTSLKIALKQYFSTYDSVRYDFKKIENDTFDNKYSFKYYGIYCDAIIHLQHFIELIMKQFLKKRHPLLVVDARDNVEVLDKLLKNETVSSSDVEKLHFVEYSVALNRLTDLIKKGRINDPILEVFKTHNAELQQLNNLRNRIWHRGMFALKYNALDELFGVFLLPIVKKIIVHPDFSRNQEYWMYKKIHCGIDPLAELLSELKKPVYSKKKIAWLKELGRAAYISEILSEPMPLKKSTIQTLEKAAKAQIGSSNIKSITTCPVCGTNTMAIYSEIDDDREEDGSYTNMWESTYRAKCISCTFEVTEAIGNPSDHGLTQINDIWD